MLDLKEKIEEENEKLRAELCKPGVREELEKDVERTERSLANYRMKRSPSEDREGVIEMLEDELTWYRARLACNAQAIRLLTWAPMLRRAERMAATGEDRTMHIAYYKARISELMALD